MAYIDIEASANRRRLESKLKSKQEKKDKGIAPKAISRTERIGNTSQPNPIKYNTIKTNTKLTEWETEEDEQ